MQCFVHDLPPGYCFVSLLRRGQLWSMPPGSAGLRFCFDASGNVMTELLLAGRDVMAFLGLSCLLWMLYLSGKLLQLFYQALIDEAKRFHFVCIGLHCFHCPRGSAAHIVWWILNPWWISVTPSCVPSRYHQ